MQIQILEKNLIAKKKSKKNRGPRQIVKWRCITAMPNGDAKWRGQLATPNSDAKWHHQMEIAMFFI